MSRIRPDDEVENADWTKRTWDLPRTREQMMALLPSRRAVEDFLELPVARWNPEIVDELRIRDWYLDDPAR